MSHQSLSCEKTAKKSIGVMDAIFMALGFTTSNLFHIVSPVAKGGLGLAMIGAGIAIAAMTVVGFFTLIIAILISTSLFKVIKQNERDARLLRKRKEQLEKKQLHLFSRLLYLRFLLRDDNNANRVLHKELRRASDLGSKVVSDLLALLECVYNPDLASDAQFNTYLAENKNKWVPRVTAIFEREFKKRPDSTLEGFFAGFISFMGMNSGFLGTYSAIITLAAAVTTVNLAIPVLGWVIFGISFLLAFGVGMAVRHFTRSNAQQELAFQETTLAAEKLGQAIIATHCLEKRLLQQNIITHTMAYNIQKLQHHLNEKDKEIVYLKTKLTARNASRFFYKKSASEPIIASERTRSKIHFRSSLTE